uniref:glutaredoxin n=1 Tax=Timspurckia oligopyrenoides TaxID=708627 RepID=UPI001FCD6B3A|nr:glutaredoxin [Timspurckia oligopyrenoides]UNJ17436.1 glutaredoxin [Timspurckia oligopyrenoides]
MFMVTKHDIDELLQSHAIVLFIKGTKLMPMCGFSNTAVQVLNRLQVDYHTVNVLEDSSMRQMIKEYSNWPTIPQLYVHCEFVGGTDIMTEMYHTGELQEIIEKASAS